MDDRKKKVSGYRPIEDIVKERERTSYKPIEVLEAERAGVNPGLYMMEKNRRAALTEINSVIGELSDIFNASKYAWSPDNAPRGWVAANKNNPFHFSNVAEAKSAWDERAKKILDPSKNYKMYMSSKDWADLNDWISGADGGYEYIGNMENLRIRSDNLAKYGDGFVLSGDAVSPLVVTRDGGSFMDRDYGIVNAKGETNPFSEGSVHYYRDYDGSYKPMPEGTKIREGAGVGADGKYHLWLDAPNGETFYLDHEGNIVKSASHNPIAYMPDWRDLVITRPSNVTDEEIIARRKNENQENASVADDSSWFEFEGFDRAVGKIERDWNALMADGYDFGDLTKVFLSAIENDPIDATVSDAIVSVGKGVVGGFEGVADTAVYLLGEGADLVGADGAAEWFKADAQADVTNRWFEPLQKETDKHSFLGDKSLGIAEGVGQVGAQALVGYATGGSSLATYGFLGASSLGKSISEAYKAGATDSEAWAFGVLNAAGEVGSEFLFSGIGKAVPGMDKSLVDIDDVAAKRLASVFKSQRARNAVEYIVKSVAEGGEEVAAGAWSAFAKWITYMDEKSFGELLADENLLEQFISGTLIAAITSTGGLRKSNASGRDYITGLTQGEQTLVNEIYSSKIADAKADLTKREKAKIYNDVLESFKKGETSAYDIVKSSIGTQNHADLVKTLTRGENAFSEKKAGKIAGALIAQANGLELTEAQSKLLESVKDNPKVQQALDNVINNERSTVSYRTQKLHSFETDVKANAFIEAAAEASGKSVEEVKAALAGEDTTKEETASKGSYEVSAKGKTLNAKGDEITITGIASLEKGKLTLKLSDGSTIDSSEVSYSSKGEAMVYEVLANMDAVIDADTAYNLVKAYDPSSGISAEVYARGLNQAYTYGFYGYKRSDMTAENALSALLTEEQRNYAYEAGREYAEKHTEGKDAGIKDAYATAKSILRNRAKTGQTVSKSGEVIFEDGLTKEQIAKSKNGKQKSVAYLVAKKVSDKMGNDIHLYKGAKEFGFRAKNGDIWLNVNATADAQSMMLFTLSHELVHNAREYDPKGFKEFADALVEQYGEHGKSVHDMVLAKQADYASQGKKLPYDKAYEEVVCDACERMLLDSNALEKLQFIEQKHPGIIKRIIDSIRNFLTRIREIFADVAPYADESRFVKEMEAGAQAILNRLFENMMVDSGKHYSTIKAAFGKGTVVETNANGEFTIAKSEDGSELLYNLATWEKGGRETLQASLEAEGFSDEDIKAALTIMDGKHKLVKELAEQFPEQDRINKATITTDLKDGHSVLSALVSNGDYPVNIDLLMVCKKRKAYQRVINRLCETGMIHQATVDALAIAEINKILGKYGFETACLGCFVESRRLRIQEWANTIVKEWNAEVKKRKPDAKAFGFGKGEATLTQDEVMQLVGELEGHEKNDQGNLNLGQGSAVKRMGVLLDKVPSLRKTLSVEDLITPDGLSSLRKYDSNLFSMVKSRYGSNSPKFVQEFNPYNHELSMYGKVPSEYKSLREYLYAIGGARMQSFSDFIVENWFDYCQIVADLAARKLPMHTYTKEIALAKLFGLTGIKINMSLIPDIDRSLGREFAGLTRNANGELELIWADKDRFKATGGKSYMQSINFADAIALQNDPKYSSNVGTIAVGVSDKHILMMLDDSRIRMVIPYHSSGMNPIFADLMGTSYYKDYTMFQNTTVKQLYNSKGEPVSLKLDKTQNDKLVSGFQFNAVLQELGDARAAAQSYKDWCADASKHTITIKGETYTAELTPKFDSFSWHDNYYKLLEDFNTYDCISEQAAPQGDVQQTYPEDFDQILRGELTAQESHRQKQEANQSFDKAMGEIESYLSTHTKADTVFYAEQHGVKLSAKDKKLSASDKAKLKALRDADFKMPKAKDSPTYEELIAKDPISVVDIGQNSEGLSYANLKEMVMKDVRERKMFDFPHPNKDTNVMIFLTDRSFTHAFSNLTSTFGEDTILAMGHIPEIIHEAVLTHVAPPKDPNKAESRVFTFFAAIEGKNGIEPVKLTVKEYAKKEAEEFPSNIRKYFEEHGEQEMHNRLYDAEVLEVISIESTKKESGASASDRNRATRFATKGTPNSTIKIADLLKLVNGDAKKYIPLPDKTKIDQAYLDAVNNGDMETAQRMVDEAMIAAGYDTRGFHGTNGGNFTKFDWEETQRADAGWYGRGHYFATSKGEAAMYGRRVIPAGLRIPKAFNFEEEVFTVDGVPLSRGTTNNVVTTNIAFAINMSTKFPHIWGDNTFSAYDNINGGGTELRWDELHKKLDSFMNDNGFKVIQYQDGHYEWMYDTGGWRTFYTHNNYATKADAEADKMSAAIGILFGEVYKIQIALSPEATYIGGDMDAADAFSNELIRQGYDGVKQATDGDEIVVFDSANIKDASPITYDDNGNIIPLSERFNVENDDIRYKLPNTLRDAQNAATVEALEKQNEKLREDVSYLKELLKLQRSVTGGKKITRSSVETVARNLKKEMDAKGNSLELAGYLNQLYSFIAESDELTWEGIVEKAQPAVAWLREHGNMEKDVPAELLEQELLRKVYDGYWNVSTLYTVADVKQKEINNLRAEHRQRMQRLRESHSKTIAKLMQQQKQRIEDLRQYYHESTDRKLDAVKERYKEQRQRAVESRERTVIRHKIQSVVGELNQFLLNDDKKRHVPDSLKKAVADALALVNMDNLGVEKRIADINHRLEDLYRQKAEADRFGDQAQQFAIQSAIDDEISLMDRYTKMGDKLKKLHNAYEDIQNSDDPDIANGYDPAISANLKELSESIGNTSLRDMSVEQLQDVYDMYKMVLTRVRDANKSLIESIKETIANRASRVVGEVRRAGGEHKYRATILDPVRSFFWNNAKPVYAMEHIGSRALIEAYNNVRKGEDTWAIDVNEARAYYIDKSKKYGYDSWDFDKKYTFESVSGQEFELTLEQIMSLYAYSKRDQAYEHLGLGGFVFDSNIETYKETVEEKDGKKKVKKSILKYKVNTADAHQISFKVLAEITGTLDKEQTDFVDEMQEYLSNVMGAKGNEVTMKMYGVKLFKEKFYFPLKSAKQFMFEQNEVSGEVRIKNSGFTNKTKPHANNPIILNNFMDVWANHVNDMSMYHAFVLPLEDFNRIFNYNSPKKEGVPPVSVKGTIQSAYSPAAVNYVKQLITDLNGGAMSDPRETIAKSLMAKFKKAKVFSSMSVVIQQPSAIGRAFALISPKYFRPTKDGMSHDELWAELKKYAPVAVIKEMGYFDTNMGKSTLDFIKGKEYTTFTEKAKAIFTDSDYRDEKLSRLPALADELTWCSIWNAVKRETVATHKDLRPGSEEFLKAAGERFTEVVTKTQVYDSVLARSANMRSKGGLMSMITAFMAEPTTTINMLEDAIRKGNRGYKGYAAKAFASVVFSIILNNALVSLVYGARDDDEDETFAEKYAQAFVSGMLDDVNPITYYPFLKDMWSVLQGYDVERSDMSLVSDVASAMKSMVKAYTTEDGDPTEAWWSIAEAVANIAGIPMQNIRKDVNGVINFYNTITSDNETTWGSMGDALNTAFRDTMPVVGWFPGDTKSDNLYDAIVSGDKDYVNRLKGSYDSENAYHNAVRKALRENDPRIKEAAIAGYNGDPSERVRIAKLIIADGFDRDDVVVAINAEINAMKPDDSSTGTEAKGFYTVEDFAIEISNGDQAAANAAKSDVIRTLQKNGKSAEEAEKSFASSAKTKLKDLYLDGKISGDKVINALTIYCGSEYEDAVSDIQYWDFKQDYPEVFADDAWVDEYYNEVESSGISLKVFIDYRNQVKGITGEGKKERRMAIINSLPITSAQKDALYFAEGWSAGTLYEAPWH